MSVNAEVERGMVMDCGTLVLIILKVSLFWGINRAEANLVCRMEIFTRDSSKIMCLKVRGFTNGQTVKFMMDIFRREKNMDLVSNAMLMEMYTKVALFTIKKKEMEYINGRMEHFFKVNINKILSNFLFIKMWIG